MGRMQFEVGGTWGVMEMSCSGAREGVHSIGPKVLGPQPLCWAGTLSPWVLAQSALQGVPVASELPQRRLLPCDPDSVAERSYLGHLPH